MQQPQQQQPPQPLTSNIPPPPPLVLSTSLVQSTPPALTGFTAPLQDCPLPNPHTHPISASIGSIYSTQIIQNQHPLPTLPQSFYSHSVPPRPTLSQVQNYTEDVLFYTIHGPQFEPTTAHSLKVMSLRELHARSWIYYEDKTTTNSYFWVLDVSNPDVFANYSYLDAIGAAQLHHLLNTATKVLLVFTPDKWSYQFTQNPIRARALTLDELLK